MRRMSNFKTAWKKENLIDLCDKIGSGATPRGGKESYKNSGISLFRSQNILDFEFATDGLAFINEEQAAQLANVVVEKDDVLINITGDSVARTCMTPCDFLPARVNQHVAIIRTNPKKAVSHFVFYYLQHIKANLLSLASAGATRNALTKKMLEDIEVYLPKDIKKQQKISDTLSFLDDKIALNKKINHHLTVSMSATDSSPDIRRGKRVSRIVTRRTFSMSLVRTCSNNGAVAA